ncbi:GTP 3',8-cyclase MoaA [Miltoncostaea marina]|uniref:GTP 3',8-cyclase MoaA n=1 Tax=Miltoncostaea marina TaxID=2843215 RepID=UPI001C3D2B26|nr:GTP 3',8-cyclase MoaA [Miltoncostaea marina]
MGEALRDGFGRVHRSLRVSVTDRCNLRCRYCMPAEGMEWIPRADLLTDDEIARLVRLFASMGIAAVRVTGGEPLVRPGLAGLVRRMAGTPGIAEVSLTTNGVLLADAIDDLVAAGLARVNVSIDSLDPERFARITRRDDLGRALAGLAACERHPGLAPLKVNAVAMRGVSEPDVLPLAEAARTRPWIVRFIEVMPLDAPREWTRDLVLSGGELRAMIGARWPLVPAAPTRASATGTRWRFADGAGEMEFVASVTEPFCATCDRLRLTADGRLRTCLFAEEETDLLGPMRAGAGDGELAAIARAAVARKGPGHGMADPAWTYAGRPMSRIGG